MTSDNTPIKPWIRTILPEISPPSLKDNTADVDRLIRGIKKSLKTEKVEIAFSQIREIPRILTQNKYHVKVALYETDGVWRLIDLFSPDTEHHIYGVSIDLGSSTVVVRLINLDSGAAVDEFSFHNPQIQIGPDILTRIHYAAREGGLKELKDLLVERINKEIIQLAGKHGITPNSIVGMAVAGNTTMTHLFLGLDPYRICREPYIPVVNRLDILKAFQLEIIINPQAPVLVFPNIGSYFGGDLIAGILSSGMSHKNQVSFLIDVGTNAEVVIGNNDWMMACAGAAGPALEGGVAGMGMMAGPGVIDKVVIDPETLAFDIRTIGGLLPIGICGSGLIDLVAQLFLSGMIDLRGKFVRNRCMDRLTDIDEIRQLVIVYPEDSGTGRALCLSQPDIDALIRSKAAMYTILTTISNTVSIPFTEIETFYVAGTFGTYIDPRSAIVIGMIPDRPLETYVPLGNTSLEGATMALVSCSARDEIFQIRDKITYIELNVNQEFMNLFSAAKFIPHTDKALFPSVRVKEYGR
ncbi:Iron-sulfur cluster-binding family protein [uncultured Desulfobacterium sp.]|uniref:Iron-sulfur cluster-binding family protein n=1 Tax=uncultured Desulfobacterium sp. TaxID=201089 RepID=A0A445MUG0_9BACT|nr:Iron-sulfur cluster-binding family protein [uncultured Desulfobacterium sp.]